MDTVTIPCIPYRVNRAGGTAIFILKMIELRIGQMRPVCIAFNRRFAWVAAQRIRSALRVETMTGDAYFLADPATDGIGTAR